MNEASVQLTTEQELRAIARLIASHRAQDRALSEARELLLEEQVDHNDCAIEEFGELACTCPWCERVRKWLAATAQETEGGER